MSNFHFNTIKLSQKEKILSVKTLLAPIHNPDNLLLEPLKKWLPALLPLYKHLIFILSKTTTVETISFLEKQKGISIVYSNGYYLGAKNAFKEALNYNELYHWIDGDRILHWISKYPKELKLLLSSPPQYDYTIVGRTSRAKATHPKSWIDCESLCNYLAERKLGIRNVDICVANILLSRRAIELILTYSKATNWGILTEWPLIILKHMDKNTKNKLGYIEVEGNEWEDTDRYQTEIKKAGSLNKWIAQRYDTETEWLKRLQNSIEIITPLKEV